MATKRIAAIASTIVCALVIGGTAIAAKVGDPLFVKAKNTKLMKTASATADVVGVLQPGEKVTWQGAEADKKWQKIQAKAGSGVVFVSNLSSKPPSTEISATKGGSAMDTQAFASSGAATKALGEGPKAMASQMDLAKAAEDLKAAEELGKKVSSTDIANHCRKVGIFQVVGEATNEPEW